MEHLPVLKEQVLQYLNPKPNENFVDCTCGFAGHTVAILDKNGPKGKVLGIEIDPEIYQKTKLYISSFTFHNRLVLVNDSYTNLKEIIKKEKFGPVHGILLDIGVSSFHFDTSGRGFSFQKDEMLDMRFSQNQALTAQKIINEWSEEDLARIFKEYGQERFAGPIAKKIVEARKIKDIETTLQLVEIVRKAFPRSYKFGKIHFATRIFQALRIAVNSELENLKAVLPQAVEVLEKGGRLAIISFHSLEDSIVKNFFKENSQKGLLQILTKKPIQPLLSEVKENHRARSAKLRVAERT